VFRPDVAVDVALLIDIAESVEDILDDPFDLSSLDGLLPFQVAGQFHFVLLLNEEGIAVLGEYLIDVDDMLLLLQVQQRLLVEADVFSQLVFLDGLMMDGPQQPDFVCLLVAGVEERVEPGLLERGLDDCIRGCVFGRHLAFIYGC
jgi:hypothetical protein